MSKQLPSQFDTEYVWEKNGSSGQLVLDGCEPVKLGTPNDIDKYSPGHLLVSAAEACLANYVFAIADMSNLKINEYGSTAEGFLEGSLKQGYQFSKIVIYPIICVESGKESTAKMVIKNAHKHCLVGRSLNCPIEIKPVVQVS